MEKVIKRIVDIRTKKGFSYENMAMDLGISTFGYRKIEIGETKLSVERLLQIAEILETSIIDLLDLKNEQYNQSYYDNSTGYQKKNSTFTKKTKKFTRN